MDQALERRLRRVYRKELLARRRGLEDYHRAWLLEAGFEPVFTGIGREETFTGVLLASLLNPQSRPVVLRGLGISDGMELTSVTADALPVDLVLSFTEGEQRQLPFAIEVKWADSPSNYPGYTKDIKGQPPADDAPSIRLPQKTGRERVPSLRL
jgi:hypothetical protein